jgi:hypothetical protein
LLGATLPKEKSKDLIVVDLGTRTMADTDAKQYSFFMLQDGHKPCGAVKK